MAGYFLRRILLIIPTFLGITLLVFSITRVVPGGPIERMMTQAQLGGEAGRSITCEEFCGEGDGAGRKGTTPSRACEAG